MVYRGRYVPHQFSQKYAIMCVFAFDAGDEKRTYTKDQLWQAAEPYLNESIYSNANKSAYIPEPQIALEKQHHFLKKMASGYRLNLGTGKQFVKALRDLPAHMRRPYSTVGQTPEYEIYTNFRKNPSEGIILDVGNQAAPPSRKRAGGSLDKPARKRQKKSRNQGPRIPRELKPYVRPRLNRMGSEEVYAFLRSGGARLQCGFQTRDMRRQAQDLLKQFPEYIGFSHADHPEGIKNNASDRYLEIRRLPPPGIDLREPWIRKLVAHYSINRNKPWMDKTWPQLETAMMMLSVHVEEYHNWREIKSKEGYKIGDVTTKLLRTVDNYRPCCRGIYASGFQAVIVAAYLTKDKFGNAWERNTLAFEADLICEENMSRFKGWNKLATLTGLIKICQRNKVKNLITLTPEGEECAKKLIAYNRRMNSTSPLNPIKIPDVYAENREGRNSAEVAMQNSAPNPCEVQRSPPKPPSPYLMQRNPEPAFQYSAENEEERDFRRAIELSKQEMHSVQSVPAFSNPPPKPPSPYRVYSIQDEERQLQEALELSNQAMNQGTVPQMSQATEQFFFRRVQRVMFAKHLDKDCNFVLLVDNREQPGQSTQLRKVVCNLAEANGMNYSVQRLLVGDYIFLFAYGDMIMPLFMLFERKSASDFASSMKDGRLKKQIRAMLHIKQRVLALAPQLKEFVEVNLILEGSFDNKSRMIDGKLYVGKSKDCPTVEQCQEQLQFLEQWDEINVIKVDSMQQMTIHLANRYKRLKAKQLEIYKIYNELPDYLQDTFAFKEMKSLLGEEQYWPDAPLVLDFVPEVHESGDVREYKQKMREMGVPGIDGISVEDVQNLLERYGDVDRAVTAAVNAMFN